MVELKMFKKKKCRDCNRHEETIERLEYEIEAKKNEANVFAEYYNDDIYYRNRDGSIAQFMHHEGKYIFKLLPKEAIEWASTDPEKF